MKVLLLGQAPLPPKHPNYNDVNQHPGRWVVDQARTLARYTNHEVTLVSLVKGATQDYEESEDGLRILYLKTQKKIRERTFFLADIYRLRKAIREISPDVCHAHGAEDAYALALLGTKYPRVLTIQNLYWDINRQEDVKILSPPWAIERLEALAINRYDRAITKSENFRSLVRERFPHLTIDIIANTPSPIFMEAKPVTKQERKIAFVGSVLKRKGFHLLTKALSTMDSTNPYELNIYGYAADIEFLRREVSLVRAAGHDVVIHGKVNATQLLSGLLDTQVLVAPSYMEPYGNQVIEAMLCGCHCIVSENTGMAENVRSFGNGQIVPQRDSRAIAEALRYVGTQSELSDEKTQKATSGMIRELLGPESIAGLLNRLYDQISEEAESSP